MLGARVEIAFMARHVGAPEFSEVDRFLRERGFILFTLSRELMLRRNMTHSPLSQPQAVTDVILQAVAAVERVPVEA